MKGKLKRQITLIVVVFILLSSVPVGIFALMQMNKDKTILTNSVNTTINGTLDSMSEGFSGAILSWLRNIAIVPAQTMEEMAKYGLEKIDVFSQINNKAAQKQVEQYSEMLQNLVENYQKVLENSVSQIAIVKTTGGYVFSYPPRSEYVSDIRTEPWYEKALETGTIAFSPPFRNPDTGELEVAMGYPLKEGDNMLGVIGIYLSLDQVSQISHLSAVKKGDKYSSFFFLVYIPDDDNEKAPIIFAYPDEKYVGLPMNLDFVKAYGSENAREIKMQFEKKLQLTDKEKENLKKAYETIKGASNNTIVDITLFGHNLKAKIHSIPGTPWKMVATINKDIWFAPVIQITNSINKTRNFFIIFLLTLVIIATVLSYIILAKIFDPLVELERKILRMGQGDLREDLDYPYDNDIKLIVNAVNEMKNNLKNTIEILRHHKRSDK